MRKFIRDKAILNLIIVPIFAIWGGYEYFKTGETAVLKIALVALVVNLILYFFIAKKDKAAI